MKNEFSIRFFRQTNVLCFQSSVSHNLLDIRHDRNELNSTFREISTIFERAYLKKAENQLYYRVVNCSILNANERIRSFEFNQKYTRAF